METVPDMDALLDELEEVVVGNKPSHPKNSKPCADQTVVIELPLHLRKLSETEMIRIDLKPPDPSLVEAEVCSTVTADPVMEAAAKKMQKESHYNGLANVDHSGILRNESGEHQNGEGPQSSNMEGAEVEQKKDVESEKDTEFEEVLKYLNQFEGKDSVPLDDGTTTALEIDMTAKNEMFGKDSCSCCSGDGRESVHSKEKDIPVDVTQKDDDSYGSSFDREDQLEVQDDDSLKTAAEAVAEAVLDAIANSVEKCLDLSPLNGNKQDTRQETSRANSVETLLDCDDETTFCCDDPVSDPNNGPVSAPEKNEASIASVAEDTVQSSVSDSTDTAPTVIHKPTASETFQDQDKVSDQRPAQLGEQGVVEPAEAPVLKEETMKVNETQKEPDVAITHQEASLAYEPRKEALPNTEQSVAEPSKAEELSEEETQSSVVGEDASEVESHVPEPSTMVSKVAEAIEDDIGSVVEEARNVPEQHHEEMSSNQNPEMEANRDEELDIPECIERERAGSEDSCHGLETAIECETREDEQPSPAPPCDRFGAQVIATIHDLSQESDPMRLTESELQLGKSKPYWIPDDDCSMCMLCNARFSLLNRRHHCRACGRVACGSCCKERATLQYMKDEPKKQGPARVCTPCASMLARIEDYEKMMREHAEGGASDDITPSTSSGSRVARGVLKTHGTSIGESEAETSQPSEGHEKKRSVVFRDGVKPGATSPSSSADPTMEEKSTTVKPKKKSRKRHAVARRVAELRLEDELGCALPTASRPQLLVVCPNGEMDMVDEEWVKARLKEELSVTIVLKKNLSCVVKICTEGNMSVFCVHSCGFATIGLDEVLFVWKRDNVDDFTVPLNVLHRIAQIYSTSCDADQAGVRQVCSRMPAIHSVPIALPPLSRHILFFPPTLQDFSNLPVPSSPFLVALFLSDAELPWAMACPNRLLLRLGLKYSWYPTPIVNIVGREAAYTTETSQTVLKVFTDFRSWSFRMKHLVGCTVTLCNDVTSVEIPKSAKQDLDEIISWNRTMIAWTTDVNLSADSHLVCEETDGFYSTQVLARGASRKATGTSFIIIDGGLKTSGLQASSFFSVSGEISVVEDGVAIRIPSEKLESLLVALDSMEDWTTIGASGSQFSVHWVDICPQSSSYGPISPIDGLNLADKYQYGLSLDRAISSVLQVSSVPDYGVRLSHVYNLKDGRLTPDDEPKVFSIAEMLARECTGMLEPYLTMLINMNIMSICVRVGVSTERVEYDVSPWCGMEDEQMKYKQNMDQLIPVLYDILGYLSGGFHIELTLSFVSTKSLPCVI
ncbi:FYVE zinc finger [Ancylostoma caninum]|uniref:FYVE zinc finger n=1 Tax=Ancylostoma caninum TaxID=29170 RepID=A0A368FW75_ANCCA|nr:FYVE zinc finger [Ancylostoma caninum]